MSKKSSSSRIRASSSALSTSASAVGAPCLARRSFSRDPAFTPIRIGTLRARASRAISRTLSWYLMLPGLIRSPWIPASSAAIAYFHWKWMSATTGTVDLAAMAANASASSQCGTATRTMSTPAATSDAICCSVALMSAVLVVVIDWTRIGASPPMVTSPTRTCRVFRRSASTRPVSQAPGAALAAEHVEHDPPVLGLVHLEQDQPLPPTEHRLALGHRDRVRGGRQEHRLHVRGAVPTFVHLVQVLRSAFEVVVGVVALVGDQPEHAGAEVLQRAVLPLVDDQRACRVRAEDHGGPLGHPRVLDRSLELLGEVQERVALRRRDLDGGRDGSHSILLVSLVREATGS